MKNGVGTTTARAALLCTGVLAALALFAGVASAADIATSAQLTGSTLAISTPLGAGTFAGELDGAPQILEGVGFTGFAVNDARGTGVGWQLTMQATPFENVGVAGTELAPDSLIAPLFDVTRTDAGSSAVPGMIQAAPIDNATGAVIASCSAAGQGMGSYRFSADAGAWKLAVTADEYAGIYHSTVTTTVATLVL